MIRVKCRLLGLHALYQFLDPVKRSLIGDSGHQTAVMLDLAIKFDAPVLSHISAFRPFVVREQQGYLSSQYDGAPI